MFKKDDTHEGCLGKEMLSALRDLVRMLAGSCLSFRGSEGSIKELAFRFNDGRDMLTHEHIDSIVVS